MVRYYYVIDGNQPVGPVPVEHLHLLAKSGVVNAGTHVLLEGTSSWLLYGAVFKGAEAHSHLSPGASLAPSATSGRRSESNMTVPTTQTCPFCSEAIALAAKKCKHCGETVDVALRVAEEAKRAATSQPMVFMNAGGGSSSSSAAAAVGGSGSLAHGTKSRLAAVLLALFLGNIGVHKFYLGQPLWGFVYLLFCWTFVPALIAFIEAIGFLLMSPNRFAQKYG